MFVYSPIDSRVGFHEPEEKGRVTLPISMAQLDQFYEVTDKPVTAPPYDFIWNVAAEEGREKHFVHQALVHDIEDMPDHGYPSEDVYVADSAMKMTLGTPNEDYDPEMASHLLHSIGEQSVQTATTQLLARGVLSKIVRDPGKAKPGRTLKISDRYVVFSRNRVYRDSFQYLKQSKRPKRDLISRSISRCGRFKGFVESRRHFLERVAIACK